MLGRHLQHGRAASGRHKGSGVHQRTRRRAHPVAVTSRCHVEHRASCDTDTLHKVSADRGGSGCALPQPQVHLTAAVAVQHHETAAAMDGLPVEELRGVNDEGAAVNGSRKSKIRPRSRSRHAHGITP